jgi:hypothetical protein
LAASKSGGGGKLGVVSLRISVPKGLVDFLKDLSTFGGTKIDPGEWARKEIVEAACATIDTFDDGEYLVASRLKEKYGLKGKEEDC